jgi:hypothetical protein
MKRRTVLVMSVIFLHIISAYGRNWSDSIHTSKPLPHEVILDESPLTDDEFYIAYYSVKIKTFFNQKLTELELNSEFTYFYFLPDDIEEHLLMPRFVKYLVKDARAIKAIAYSNVIAIHFEKDFDLISFEENLFRLKLPLVRTTKDSFINASN